MKLALVIVLCLVSALGIAQIVLLNEFITGGSGGVSLQAGGIVIIGNNTNTVPSNALLNDATGAPLLNDATGAYLLNDNP